MVRSLAELRGRIAELAALTEAFAAKAIFVTQRSGRWGRADGRVYGSMTFEHAGL